MKHLITLFDLSSDDIESIFNLAVELKQQDANGIREPKLVGKVLGLLFEKPSLRTRVSFESAMAHLGGSSLYLGQDVGWGKRESTADFSRVLSQYVDAIVCRSFDHRTVVELAEHASCNVINGLTNSAHPCQALADLLTIREHRSTGLKGAKLTFVGDGNNVSRSLATACAMTGVEFVLAAPQGYEFESADIDSWLKVNPEFKFSQTTDPAAAVENASAVYTDVWASMGQESESAKRKADFADYQVNSRLMSNAPKEAIFLHCLPAKRGEEVTNEVMDGKQSAIVQQAGNRMHVQKAILVWLLS